MINPPPLTPTSERLTARLEYGLRAYAGRIRLFTPNARLYLGYTIVNGMAFGIFRLLFNFYALSLGFNEAVLGRLLTVTNLVALVVALPSGYVSDRLGRKTALMIASVLTTTAVFGTVFWRDPVGFYVLSALLGVGQSLAGVTLGPFLMENSGHEERTYLFSFSFGVQMIAGFAGNWLGGQMPTWLGTAVQADATSATAYGLAMAVVGGIASLSIIPLLFIRRPNQAKATQGKSLSPFQYARQQPMLLVKLIAPMFVTSLGAGLLMPFMNVFYRHEYNASDGLIGGLFAVGSLAMAFGLLLAPPLADRYGKMKVVVLSQAISIPFLALMGFAPWFGVSALAYLVRLMLMNMSNPVYQTFVMEQVDEEARATVASLVSMSWNFGWAFSPMVSGWLQLNFGFGPIYLGTMLAYVVAIYLYWRFFGQTSEDHTPWQTADTPT
ncbi:MAG: MFS transporter [Chloroflexi bacterium]|nr:MFS transporter [Chloroflexota bacterium]